MATYQYFAYSSTVLDYNATTGSFVLSSGYDHTTGRILVTITDNDAYLHGDVYANETGSDSGQTAVISRPDGTVIAGGRVYDEAYAEVRAPDGGSIRLDRIEIGGVRFGYFSSEELVPEQSYPLIASYDVTVQNGNLLTYNQIQSVPCFAAGTMIATAIGEVPVERLRVGDRVLTLDRGYQPVRWSGRFHVGAASGRDEVEFAPGSLGGGFPSRPLRVTACHRMLLSDARLARYFGETEVLAAAGHFPARSGIVRRAARPGARFHHFLLPAHEIIFANRVPSESLFAGGTMVAEQPEGLRDRILDLAGDLHRTTARLCLTRWEAALALSEVRPETLCAAA